MAFAVQAAGSRLSVFSSQCRSGLMQKTRSAVSLCNVSRRQRSILVRAEKQTQDQPPAVPGADETWASPEGAEKRADLGGNYQNLGQMQAFDGPAPETINGRLCMLAVPVALWWEATTGLGIKEQTADHPWSVLAVFVIISLASYVPLARGYTRKEPFENKFLGLNWTPQAENWNGRLAMLGFTGMLLVEFYTKTNTLHFWGLQ